MNFSGRVAPVNGDDAGRPTIELSTCPLSNSTASPDGNLINYWPLVCPLGSRYSSRPRQERTERPLLYYTLLLNRLLLASSLCHSTSTLLALALTVITYCICISPHPKTRPSATSNFAFSFLSFCSTHFQPSKTQHAFASILA